MNETHDPQRRSWVSSANRPGENFPIQNLPFGVFQGSGPPAIGVAIGDQVLNLKSCSEAGLLVSLPSGTIQACTASALNALMELGPACWGPLRVWLSDWLRADHPQATGHHRALAPHLCDLRGVSMLSPAKIGDYSDYYASIDHATNVGRLFRPENPLLPNYKFLPIGYHGRASSICVSGTPVMRPTGQWVRAPAREPQCAPTEALDYEVEAGFFVGPGNRMGEPIAIGQAAAHMFGVCLVNDWSARDMQSWEYQPLGPFLAKSFATSISPWIVTMEALEPYRCPAYLRPADDPAPLPYLSCEQDRREGGIDLTVEVHLRSARMRAAGIPPACLSRGNLSSLYWTAAQMLTHHASNGCNLRAGDLLASGTISGPGDKERGCLLEITRGGREPFVLPTGERRTYLENGDEVTLHGYCEREGLIRIGLGECTGLIIG